MHVEGFLHNLLSEAIHNSRLKSLSAAVKAAVHIKELTLTSLGRALDLPIQERSAIQKINRLLSNQKLRSDVIIISQIISANIIGSKKRPHIIVDWTKYPNSKDAVIRAAVEICGRAMTIYEERHGEDTTGKPGILKRFLMNLKVVLPESCKPIIVTDAGFHNPWFKMIIGLGWDYIGRIRGKKRYRELESNKYISCTNLYINATKQPKYLGEKILTEQNQLKTHFYLIKLPPKNRKAHFGKGKWSSEKDSRKYARAHREPWLLVSSLNKWNCEKKIVSIYKRRMGIEEAFRDLKSTQYGFGLEMSKTKRKVRRDIILLIMMLVNYIATIVGVAGEKMKLQYQFQSNSIKHRRILSIFYLGCRLIKKKIQISRQQMMESIALIQSHVVYDEYF